MVYLDKFIEFLFEHKYDDRIDITKAIKFGFKHYCISLSVDEAPDNNRSVRYAEQLEILFDNRNKCIQVSYNHGSRNLIFEDDILLEKWSSKLDEYLTKKYKNQIVDVFEETLKSCYNKSLYREYQLKKIVA